MTTADFTITLDKKEYVPVKLEPDPEKPGHSLLSFSPPDDVRDGKPRQVEVKFKKRDFLKWTITFPEPTW